MAAARQEAPGEATEYRATAGVLRCESSQIPVECQRCLVMAEAASVGLWGDEDVGGNDVRLHGEGEE